MTLGYKFSDDVNVTTESGATMIGDVVASKQVRDRADLQRRMERTLHETTQRFQCVQPLQLTIGDEFQGVFLSVADATLASMLLRLDLLPDLDARFGIGVGEYEVFDRSRTPFAQDGPAWWAAREAIDEVSRRSRKPRLRWVRTRVAAGGGLSEVTVGAVNAYLLCRDETIGRLGDRARRLLHGAALGQTQDQIAKAEGITQSAVSQSLGRSGAGAVLAAQAELETSFR